MLALKETPEAAPYSPHIPSHWRTARIGCQRCGRHEPGIQDAR